MTQKLQEFEELAAQFRMIGHPMRVAILSLLCNSRCSRLTVKNIYERLNINQPTASRHLSIMRSSGILKRTQEAGKTFYQVCEENHHVACIKRCFDNQFIKYL